MTRDEGRRHRWQRIRRAPAGASAARARCACVLDRRRGANRRARDPRRGRPGGAAARPGRSEARGRRRRRSGLRRVPRRARQLGLPSRLRALGRRRARLRPRAAREPGRRPWRARGLPDCRRLPPRLRQHLRDVRRRRAAGGRVRRHAARAGDDLRDDEGHARATRQRLRAQGLRGRSQCPVADGDRPAGSAEQRRVVLGQRHLSGAARGRGVRSARRPRHANACRRCPHRGRGSDQAPRRGSRRASGPTGPCSSRASRAPPGRWPSACAGWEPGGRWARSRCGPIRTSSGSAGAGRRTSTLRAGPRSAFRATRASTAIVQAYVEDYL